MQGKGERGEKRKPHWGERKKKLTGGGESKGGGVNMLTGVRRVQEGREVWDPPSRVKKECKNVFRQKGEGREKR